MSNEIEDNGGRALDEGKVWKALIAIGGPMIVGIAAVKSVAMTDTLYVGQLGKDQLAALSFAFPVTIVVLGLSLGLSVGASSVVSRALGEDDEAGAKRLSLHTLLLGMLVMGAVAGLGILITEPLFTLMGASETTLGHISAYMRIWFIAVPFLTVAMMCDFIVRATGNAFWPTLVMTGGSLFNIGITALLVFGLWGLPEMGIEGAATGTLIAQLLTVLAGLWMVTVKAKLVSWSLPDWRKMLPSWRDTARVALPAALGNMVHPLSLSAVTAILATFSEDVVAAFGVATQIEVIAVIPLLALSAALSPIAGQNWGAGQPERIVTALKESYWLCAVWSGIVAVPLWVFGDMLAGLFSEAAAITDDAQIYLRVVPFSLFGYGMVICAAAAFNGIDRARRALGYNAVRSLLLFLPLAWIGARLFDATGLYAGIAAANVVSGLWVGWYALRWLDRERPQTSADEPCLVQAE